MRPDLVLYTGIDFILGQAIDRPISAWEESFLPVRLRQHLLQTTVTDELGQTSPLVVRSVQVGVTSRFVEADRPPSWFGWFLATGVGLAGLIVVVSKLAARRKSIWVRLLPIFLALPVYVVLAAGGTLSAWAWGFSRHWAAYGNENLFQAHPLVWPMVVLWPLAWFGRARRLATRWALGLAGLSLVGVLCKVLPGFGQENGPILALLVPAHVGLAGSLMLLNYRDLKPDRSVNLAGTTGLEAR